MVGDQVPDACLVDETVGVEGVGARAVVAAVPVAQSQAPVAEDGLLEGDEVGGKTLGTRCTAPAHGVDEDAAAGQVGVGTVRGGQRGHDLAQGGAEGLAQAQVGVRGAGKQHEQGPGFVGGQSGDVSAVAGEQGDAALGAADGVDGHTGRGQGFNVAHDRAD